MATLAVNPVTGLPDLVSTDGGSGTPGGATGALQFNDAGDFGGLRRRVFEGTAITTDDTTPQTIATIAIAETTVASIVVAVVGRSTAVGVGSVGDAIAAGFRVVAKRLTGMGAEMVDDQTLAASAGYGFATNTPPTFTATDVGNNIVIEITGGDAGTTVSWFATITVDFV